MDLRSASSRRGFLKGAAVATAAITTTRLAFPAKTRAATGGLGGIAIDGVLSVPKNERSVRYTIPGDYASTANAYFADGQPVLVSTFGDYPGYIATTGVTTADPTGATGGSIEIFLNTKVGGKYSTVQVYFEARAIPFPLP